ncbi:MAG: cytochrome c oxidase subunit II [Solirubrobacterales bacterium]
MAPRYRPTSRPSRSLVALGSALAALAATAAPAGANVISPEPPHSPGAAEISTLYWIGLVVAVVVVVAVNLGLLHAIRRYRAERGAEPRQARSGSQLQWRVAGALGVLALALFAAGIVFTEKARDVPATGPAGLKLAKGGSDPLVITATGQQWLWRYNYPNQTFTYYRLVVPVDTTVELRVLSTDVIHSWYVPELGGKVDAVPGKTNTIFFRADEEGTYSGASAQLSGQGYAAMRTEVDAVSPDRYESFLDRLESDLQAAQDQVTKETANPPGSAPSTPSRPSGQKPSKQPAGQKPSKQPAGQKPSKGTGESAAAAAGATVFASNGCGGCHTLSAAGSTGAVGPNLDKSLTPDVNAAAIEQMITDPNAKIVPGYPPNVMPQDYGKTLTPTELNDLIQYLIASTPAS